MIDLKYLISSIDILEYISQSAHFIKKNNSYWCCSPLNPSDTVPSFEVNVDMQRFYDFSTDKYGDVLQFVREYHNCNVSRAISILIEFSKIPVEKLHVDPNPEILSLLMRYAKYQHKFPRPMYKTIPPKYLERYDYDANKFKPWIEEGINEEIIKKYNIKYDFWNNCIVIPIFDNEGRIVNLSNRTLYSDFKQRNIPKYIYSFGWNGGGIDILWGYFFKKQDIDLHSKIIIVEGVKSVLKLETFGYNNCVAILTSHLNQLQMQQLIKAKVREFIFALDMNVDIKKDPNIMFLKKYGKLSFLRDLDNRLGEKDSPCDKGKEIFDDLYKHRIQIL